MLDPGSDRRAFNHCRYPLISLSFWSLLPAGPGLRVLQPGAAQRAEALRGQSSCSGASVRITVPRGKRGKGGKPQPAGVHQARRVRSFGGLWGARGEPQSVLRPLSSQHHGTSTPGSRPRKPCPPTPFDLQLHYIVSLSLGCLYFSQSTCLLNQIKGAPRIRKDRFPTRTVPDPHGTLAQSRPSGDRASVVTLETSLGP